MEKIEKIWLTEDAVWIRTADGREACEKFSDYPRLKYATSEERANFTADDYGLRWENIDEDLSFEGFFNKQPTTELYKLFMAHPELNVSAIARRMGISQSLMAQYVTGKKTPSNARFNHILETIRAVGQELIAV